MTATTVRPATPTQPLDFLGSKGTVRQLVDGSWVTWDGHDWVPTVVPGAQLDKSYVEKQADGAVMLPSGLYVTGTSPETNGNDSLWVAGNSHVTGNATVDGYVYAQDVRVKLNSTRTHWVSSGPTGEFFQYRSNSSTAAGTAEVYVGTGVSWTYDASRWLRIDYRATGYINGTGNTSNSGEMRVNLRGGPYSGSVNAADPLLDRVCAAVPPSVSSQISAGGSWGIPSGTWNDGASVYVGVFLVFNFLIPSTTSFVANGFQSNAYCLKTDLSSA